MFGDCACRWQKEKFLCIKDDETNGAEPCALIRHRNALNSARRLQVVDFDDLIQLHRIGEVTALPGFETVAEAPFPPLIGFVQLSDLHFVAFRMLGKPVAKSEA